MDPEITQLEEDLRKSRTQQWDVEAFFIQRHAAKIAELEKPKSHWLSAWVVFREITDPIAIYIGWATPLLLLVCWLLTGELPSIQG